MTKIPLHRMRINLIFVLALLTAVPSLGARTLTIEEARQIALQFNRGYLQAKEVVRSAEGRVVQARAGALPSISLGSAYNRNFKIPSMFMQITDSTGATNTMEIKTGYKNSYGASLSLVQPLWQGGKVFGAWSIAKDYRKYSLAGQDQAEAQVLYNCDVLFWNSILQRARLEVLRKSHEAATHSLDVVEKQQSQGVVSEFEVLRAKVEKSNLEPLILAAESDLRLADQRLKSFLGFPLSDEIALTEGELNASTEGLPALEKLTAVALEARPEMRQANFVCEMSRKAVGVARADYWPSLNAVSGYDWQAQSDRFTLQENVSRSLTVGLTLSLAIFDGGRTRGAVTQAVAAHNQAVLDSKQTEDNIRLDVEQAYDRTLQAKESLETQKNTIALAEEGLRIADLRYESGVGTLLEVLSAQAALTQARETLAMAAFAFRTAKAGLKLATTIDLDNMK
jgi:outer membrane protein